MADGQSGRAERLPIKLILPHQGVERRVSGGGSRPKPFRGVTREFRGRLANQVTAIRSAIRPAIVRTGGAPVRVRLLPQAFAKSHRPKNLFSDRTCPVIGAGRLGELFLKATVEGLNALEEMVRGHTGDVVVKEISSIENIEPITAEFRRNGLSPGELLRSSPRSGDAFATQVQLFDFGPGRGQDALVNDFLAVCGGSQIPVKRSGYAENSFRFEVDCRNVGDVETVSNIIGVRSLRQMPTVRGVRPQALNRSPLPDGLPVPNASDGEMPVVVVVDSGVTDQPPLSRWVVGRDQQVAPAYRNTEHGTFVAGLIAWGKHLNPDLQGIDLGPCAIFDLQLLPNDDPAHGDTDELHEPEFLQILESALQQYGDRYKVWNLSLSTDRLCSLTEFSSLAVELDNLQERYAVSFVISAGNYETVPLLNFPREREELERGRITSPADSVMSVTVGSISHHSYAEGPRDGEPSCFSRHGAGPNYIIKPDLVHFGGACRRDASEAHGVRSLIPGGCGESLGTSFATPLISRIMASIYHQIVPSPSPVLARALLTHHAREPRTQGRVSDDHVDFVGFGLPAALPYCLECTAHTSTLVFEDVLRPGYFLEWDDFPFPPSLQRGGRYFGDVWMTIAFSPSRNARWGTEYCETHIDAHFGVYRRQRDQKTKRIRQVFTGLVPPEHKNPGELFESFQVEHLRKWSPVRTYFGSLGENGERGDRWRLKVQLLSRHGIEEETLMSQPFALIVTIADPSRSHSIYDEMARLIHNRYRSQNLTLRPTLRVQQ
jgi:serine protease AprX